MGTTTRDGDSMERTTNRWSVPATSGACESTSTPNSPRSTSQISTTSSRAPASTWSAKRTSNSGCSSTATLQPRALFRSADSGAGHPAHPRPHGFSRRRSASPRGDRGETLLRPAYSVRSSATPRVSGDTGPGSGGASRRRRPVVSKGVRTASHSRLVGTGADTDHSGHAGQGFRDRERLQPAFTPPRASACTRGEARTSHAPVATRGRPVPHPGSPAMGSHGAVLSGLSLVETRRTVRALR